MKILLISNMYPSHHDPVYGNFVKEHVDELEKKGYEFDLCVVQKRGGNLFQKIMKYAKLWGKYSFFGLFKRYDLVHLHYVFPTSLFLPLIYTFTRKKVVITAHETDPLDLTGWKAKFVRYVLNRADRVIAVSDQLKADLEKGFDLSPEKVLSINCGVNREMFPPFHNKKRAKESLGLNSDKKLVLFLGRTYIEKGVYTFVNTVKALHKDSLYQFAIVGNGPETENVIKEMDALGADYIYQPSIPKEKVHEWFNAADIYIFPTEKEAFGLVALESVSCHTPVIASRTGGVPETVRDGINGFLVDVGDHVSIAKYVDIVLHDESLYQSLIAGCEEVADSYSIPNQIQKVKQCYDTI